VEILDHKASEMIQMLHESSVKFLTLRSSYPGTSAIVEESREGECEAGNALQVAAVTLEAVYPGYGRHVTTALAYRVLVIISSQRRSFI
jgi:hypothetical protein